MIAKTKFFEFDQNNSGGYFDVDENVCHRVIIEAVDEKHAEEIFKPMIACQSPSCPCCGDRWYGCHEIVLRDFPTLEDWCFYHADKYGWTKPDIRVHYLDGTKKEFTPPPKQR